MKLPCIERSFYTQVTWYIGYIAKLHGKHFFVGHMTYTRSHRNGTVCVDGGDHLNITTDDINHFNIKFETAVKCSCILRRPKKNEVEGLPAAVENITIKNMENSQTEVSKEKPLQKQSQFDDSECNCCNGSKSAKI